MEPEMEEVTTVARGPNSSTSFSHPRYPTSQLTQSSGLAVDREGNLYITDAGTYSIYKLSSNGEVSTIAGNPNKSGHRDGPLTEALFGGCYGIAVTSDGSLYVADSPNNVIRRISDGVVSTLAGKP